MTRLMRVLERRSTEGSFLAGEYSIAAIPSFAWVKAAFRTVMAQLGEELGMTPGIDRRVGSINTRAAVQRGRRASKVVLRRNATFST